MKRSTRRLVVLLVLCASHGSASEILVRVGDKIITSHQLELAMASAPYATQFPAMDEAAQAHLRGDMLLRLVQAQALYQQALKDNLDKDPAFVKEMTDFQTTLLAQRYLNTVRDQFTIPDSIEKNLQIQYKGNSDALAASRSVYVARNFTDFKTKHIEQLKRRYQVKYHIDRRDSSASIPADNVLLTGDGFQVTAQDIIFPSELQNLDPDQVMQKLEEWSGLLVLARAAKDQSIDIQRQLHDYQQQLLVSMLLDRKYREWMLDRQTLQDYFAKHLDIGYIPERRQIGQIVVASEQLAKQLREKIQSGESLFELAARYSMDPYGRKHSGDMGWLPENSGMPEIETVLKNLSDGEISPVIKTGKGYHLVIIVNRKPAERKDFSAIEDRVRQAIISEKMPAYLKQVMANFPLVWSMPDHL